MVQDNPTFEFSNNKKRGEEQWLSFFEYQSFPGKGPLSRKMDLFLEMSNFSEIDHVNINRSNIYIHVY